MPYEDSPVLFVDSVSDMYGSSRIGRLIIGFMQGAGREVDALVAVERNEPDLRYAEQAELPILVMRDFRRAPVKSLAKVCANSVRFATLLRRRFPRHRTVYCNTFATLPAAIIARVMRRRCFLHLHETSPSPAVASLLKTAIRVFGLQTVFVSQAIKESWRLENHAQAQVVHNGIPDLDWTGLDRASPGGSDAEEGRANPKQSRNWDIAFVGRLTEKKGFHVLLEALRILDTPERAGTKVLILGGCLPGVSLPPGIFSDFEHLQIDYLGERADAAVFFAQSKVACIPSLFADPFPTTALEALRAGCLVVASDTGGLPESLQGTASVLVKPGNAEELANGLAFMLSKPVGGRADLNRSQYEARFSLDRFKERFMAFFAPQAVASLPLKVAVLGTVGVPGRYGGFETLAENLVRYHKTHGHKAALTVWCSAKDNVDHPTRFESADLRYVGLRANGAQSILYDAISLWQAVRSGHDRILLLGVSGALALPLIRLVSRARILTNIDGIEWKREKWKGLARMVLHASEWAAVRFSHEVIADNQAIADHARDTYGIECHVVAYGGDHALDHAGEANAPEGLPDRFALALCRIEPENNVHVILEALDGRDTPLVFVGNWDNSAYGRDLKAKYGDSSNLYLLDPVYDPGTLHALRARASVYLHGHSAGGTNPSLVEMMHFNIPVIAHGCAFNRFSTEGKARYFETPAELTDLLEGLDPDEAARIGADMREIAQHRYTWDQIGKAYFELLDRV
ncbi:glycosyltransferase family 4 protein [Shimia haliotis]|uniref:Glycosyltransferase involved in cell wall bisynthesis n=1 Tax=Shimia haliotis TaxID=1280847 RepID=A0A1I4C7A2_9RHOB|nr:glycosyltransferase [Shimia haliotis]SFK76036.1 Glycosyltransferase involved in cell wall bisynthesis [Shimia haliotis]